MVNRLVMMTSYFSCDAVSLTSPEGGGASPSAVKLDSRIVLQNQANRDTTGTYM